MSSKADNTGLVMDVANDWFEADGSPLSAKEILRLFEIIQNDEVDYNK